jgi:hypothetical protein
MSDRKSYGEFLKFDVNQFVERNIKYKGEDIQILIRDKSGKQEINELQESIFNKLSNKKELDSLDNYCKSIIEKEIKEDFFDKRFIHKYSGIESLRIEENGIVVVFPTILRQDKNNPDEVQIDSTRNIRISKYKNILMKGENFMPQKAYSEFMKSKPTKNENNNSTKLKETAVVDKKDSVYGRVLEVAEIFHYTDDPEEDVIIQYALGNDRDYLTRPQLEFHAELQYDAKRLLTKVDTACIKQSSKEIKKDNMYAVLSAFNRLVVDGDGNISAEYYGYVNKGNNPSRPTPEEYQAYEYVDTLKTTFHKAMGRGENMNLNKIMNRTAFGESVVTTNEEVSTREFKEYKSVKEIRNDYIKAMKLSALSESTDDLRGPVQALSERIIKIKDNILDFATFAESVEPTDFAGVAHLQDRKDLIMKDLKTVSNVLDKSDKELNDHYQDSVANSILSLMTVNDSVKAKDLVECPAEKIAKDNEKDIAELKELNPVIGKTVEDKYEEVKDALKNEENDLVYNPTEKKDGLVPVAEMPSGEGFFAYGEAGGADSPEARKFTSDQNKLYKMPVNWQKGGAILAGIGGVGAGLALLHTLMAVPFNIWITSKNNKVEKQFGSALNIQQPLVATDDISKDVINSYAKYLETSAAIQIKQALESSIAQTDGGNLMSRAKSSLRNTFTNMNKTDRSGKNIKDDSEEILSSFSQSYNPVMDCMTKVFSRNAEAASLIFNIQNLVSSGEAGEFINDNKHAPKSTIQVEILYKDINDVTSFSRKTMSKKSSLTVDVSSRKLPYEDVVKTILEMNEKYFGSVKVTPAEKNTEKSLKNSVAFVKKEGTSKEKQVLTSNKFADIINKVERIKTPLFHLVISNQAYHDLKHRGMDIKNKETYRQLMKRLPIISIAIADEDTEIMSYSHGPYPMFRDVQFKDLENEISKYEKELQSMIKFGAQR